MKKKVLLGIALILPPLMFLTSGSRTNPRIVRQIRWDSPRTKALFYRACADCHSHETRWPWYSWFAPVSWLVISDVNSGRESFNISTENMGNAEEAASQVEEDEMPLAAYLFMHPEARLSAQEKSDLIDGLDRTFNEPGQGSR